MSSLFKTDLLFAQQLGVTKGADYSAKGTGWGFNFCPRRIRLIDFSGSPSWSKAFSYGRQLARGFDDSFQRTLV